MSEAHIYARIGNQRKKQVENYCKKDNISQNQFMVEAIDKKLK